MSWLFSQALVEAFSEDHSLGGEPCAQLNVMPTAQPFWRNDKPMDCSRFSRFGLTSQPLTENAGEALLTSFLADFPVKISAPQVPVTALTEPEAVCGFKWPGSFAKYSPSGCSWKTRQCSLLGGLVEYSETWPRWGSMRDGECSVLPSTEPTTYVKESGLLPTPVVIDSGSRFNQSPGAMARFNLWPTPMARGTLDGGSNSRKAAKARGMWPTPKANDSQKRGNFDVNNPRNGLPAAVRKFPTPTVSMRKGSSGGSLTRKSGKSRENDRLDYAIEGDGLNGRLNPEWIEWLMGWPIGWTALQPLETDRFLEWQQQHGCDSVNAHNSNELRNVTK